MPLDVGRVTHLANLMHRAEASNGSAVASNWILSTDGTKGVEWRPESAGTPSYGSNANDVDNASAGGASALASRADHVHRGVRTVTSNGSNGLFGDVNLSAGAGIALGVAGQSITVTNTGSAGGGSSVSYASNSNEVSYANAAGASALVSRADHVHRGVTSVSHTSNTFSGPVILTTSGSLGITVPTPGTFNLSAGSSSDGGGGTTAVAVYQTKQFAPNGSTTVVLDSTPTAGHRIILGLNRLGTSTTTATSSTNTTWTMLLQYVTGGSCYEIWVGVCAASPGATITFTAGNSNYNSVRAIEIDTALTPTVGVTSTAAAASGSLTGLTAGRYVIGLGGHVNTGLTATIWPLSAGASGNGLVAAVVPMFIIPVGTSALYVEGAGGSAVLLAEVS